jgi:NitT/TauT family transport system permease protein
MTQNLQVFHASQQGKKQITWGDAVAGALVVALLYVGVRLAFGAPSIIPGPDITLSPSALPVYTLLSVGRMSAAYALSLLFSIVYGRAAAYHPRAEQLLMPLLDVLQSVPILSFLPVILLSLSSFLPQNIAAELASILLIFTSQAWNLTFAWYQSLTTVPKELREASAVFRLNPWMKFKTLELPFGMISLIWNSMMSWAGGWFFLMAAEIFTVGSKDFRLPGLGAYLQEAAVQSDYRAIAWGVAVLILTVILLDQLVWRPLIAWSDRFKIEMVENDNPPTSWFFNLMGNSRLTKFLSRRLASPLAESFDRFTLRRFHGQPGGTESPARRGWTWALYAGLSLLIAYGLFRAAVMLFAVRPDQWGQIGVGIASTFLRVLIALFVALAWTVPVGVLIGTHPRLSAVLQPIVQITASVPATGLFPILLLIVLNLNGGLNLAAVILMLMGTQWYLLFNIIAGASAIPQDLIFTTRLMQLGGWQRWRTLILPAIFPYLVTGAITASGGAWNASIVAEYQNFGGQALSVTGIGSLITHATAAGDYPLLLAATLALILTVILINRLLWRKLYRLADEKYRME